MAHIQDREMVLRYHQFSTDDIRVIAKALCVRKSSYHPSIAFDGFFVVVQSEYRAIIVRWELFTTTSCEVHFSNDYYERFHHRISK